MVQLLRDMGDNPLVLRRAPPLQSADASPGLLILTPQAGQTTAAMQEIAWNGPILIILPVALTDQRYLSLPEDGISFRHFQTVLTSPVMESMT